MKRLALGLALATAAAATGCVENTAPGNDREAELAAPAQPAQTAAAGAALAGVSTGLLKPEIMPDMDLRVVADAANGCRFHFTRVGFPVFLYPENRGGPGIIKLNGKLVRLPSTGDGQWSDSGVRVTIRELAEQPEAGEPFEAEMVLRLPDKEHELGFIGFSSC